MEEARVEMDAVRSEMEAARQLAAEAKASEEAAKAAEESTRALENFVAEETARALAEASRKAAQERAALQKQLDATRALEEASRKAAEEKAALEQQLEAAKALHAKEVAEKEARALEEATKALHAKEAAEKEARASEEASRIAAEEKAALERQFEAAKAVQAKESAKKEAVLQEALKAEVAAVVKEKVFAQREAAAATSRAEAIAKAVAAVAARQSAEKAALEERCAWLAKEKEAAEKAKAAFEREKKAAEEEEARKAAAEAAAAARTKAKREQLAALKLQGSFKTLLLRRAFVEAQRASRFIQYNVRLSRRRNHLQASLSVIRRMLVPAMVLCFIQVLVTCYLADAISADNWLSQILLQPAPQQEVGVPVPEPFRARAGPWIVRRFTKIPFSPSKVLVGSAIAQTAVATLRILATLILKGARPAKMAVQVVAATSAAGAAPVGAAMAAGKIALGSGAPALMFRLARRVIGKATATAAVTAVPAVQAGLAATGIPLAVAPGVGGLLGIVVSALL